MKSKYINKPYNFILLRNSTYEMSVILFERKEDNERQTGMSIW